MEETLFRHPAALRGDESALRSLQDHLQPHLVDEGVLPRPGDRSQVQDGQGEREREGESSLNCRYEIAEFWQSWKLSVDDARGMRAHREIRDA